jgi:hypothetical protein
VATDPALATRIKNAAIILRDAARGFASWSRHIPERIDIQMRDDADGAYIIATGGQARAYELNLRHPLNYPGQKGWGNTPWRPFLSRAVDSQGDAAADEVARVVDDWLDEWGEF